MSLAALSFPFLASSTAQTDSPPVALLAPFAITLVAIALMPFVNRQWWERNYHFVAVGLGSITVGYYVFIAHAGERMLHAAHEYVSFLSLIGSLYVVAGGIHISVRGESTPLRNAGFLLGGAILANFIGTTGASMLLIRPWIRMNKYRITAFHIVFFIFLVSNVGGCLTPIGDPPLFLGFLKGIPFWWVARKCLGPWLIAVSMLLVIFYWLDRRNFLRAPGRVRDEVTASSSWKIRGAHNAVFLGIIAGAVFISGPAGLREAVMLAAAFGSWMTTSRDLHQANEFNFHALQEVAWLFLGIFATMVPALDYLRLHAGSFGLHSPMQFYWITGVLSGLLDNAPTYLTTLASALGNSGASLDNAADLQRFAQREPLQLMAISLAAVFFGGATYIGNGPNFLVKTIAENAKVKMPGFFGYVIRYSLPWLGPVLMTIALIYLRG